MTGEIQHSLNPPESKSARVSLLLRGEELSRHAGDLCHKQKNSRRRLECHKHSVSSLFLSEWHCSAFRGQTTVQGSAFRTLQYQYAAASSLLYAAQQGLKWTWRYTLYIPRNPLCIHTGTREKEKPSRLEGGKEHSRETMHSWQWHRKTQSVRGQEKVTSDILVSFLTPTTQQCCGKKKVLYIGYR